MNINRFIKFINTTKNTNKIINEFNKFNQKEKEQILLNNTIKKRLYKINDIEFIINLIIDLSYQTRINFIGGLNSDNYTTYNDRIILEFLKLEDYNDFKLEELNKLKDIKEKQIISLMFRKLSPSILEKIIYINYNQALTDYAFIEYSKKMNPLKLNLKLIKNLSENILFNSLKKRNKKNTILEVDDFIEMDSKIQNPILVNGNFDHLETEIKNYFIKKYLNKTEEEIIKEVDVLTQKITYVKLLELHTIINLVSEEISLKLLSIYFKNIYGIENVEEKYLKSANYIFKNKSISFKEIYNFSKLKPFSFINYLNTGIIDENIDNIFKEHININQYQKTNIKKINKIINLVLKKSKEDADINDINYINNKINLIILSYKLYYILGYENSLELLNNKFGNINIKTLNTLFSRCIVNSVEFKKVNNSYEPILKQEFIQFIIGNKKDNNTTIKRILRDELELIVNEFYNLYNNFERYQQTIGNKIHLNNLIPLIEENPFALLPNEYKLTKKIINDIIKSYRYRELINPDNQINNNSENDKKSVLEACEFYHNSVQKRIISSIPRVIGQNNNYQYEVLKLDDPVIMTLGYQTNCCFRLNGASKEFLKYCSESPYARVIVIRNENNEICAMVPIIRNGNVIVGNSIERNLSSDNAQVYSALKEAFNDILNISTQTEQNPIIACCVTDLHGNVARYSKRKIEKNIFPIRHKFFYTNYEYDTYIVTSLEEVNESDFKLYTPESIYYDERPEILMYHWSMKDKESKNEIDKRVKSICYQLGIYKEELYMSSYIICNEDWFIKIGYDGIKGYYLSKDPRAKIEFEYIKQYLETKFQNKRYYEIKLDETDVNSLKLKRN